MDCLQVSQSYTVQRKSKELAMSSPFRRSREKGVRKGTTQSAQYPSPHASQ